MAVPSEKLSKYEDLEIETTRKWGMKTEIIPVFICALGLIKKGLEKHTSTSINYKKLLYQEQPYGYGRFCLKSKIYQPCCAL